MRQLSAVVWSATLAVLLAAGSLAAPFALTARGQAVDEQGPERSANPRNAIHAEADRGMVKLESPRFT